MAVFSFWFRLLLCCWPWSAGPAQRCPLPEKAAATQPLPPDAGPAPRLRLPDAARLRELRGQRAFQYMEPVTRPQQSAWSLLGAGVARPWPSG